MRCEIAREHTDMPVDETIIEEQLPEGDRMVTCGRYCWKHDQTVVGEIPSAQWLDMEGVHIDRIMTGKIAQCWEVEDSRDTVTRLGRKASFPGESQP
jgi:predicted ester cyclase